MSTPFSTCILELFPIKNGFSINLFILQKNIISRHLVRSGIFLNCLRQSLHSLLHWKTQLLIIMNSCGRRQTIITCDSVHRQKSFVKGHNTKPQFLKKVQWSSWGLSTAAVQSGQGRCFLSGSLPTMPRFTPQSGQREHGPDSWRRN